MSLTIFDRFFRRLIRCSKQKDLGLDVLEVGGNLPQDFVFNILKVNSWMAIEELEFWKATDEKYTNPILDSHKSVSSFLVFQNTQFDKYIVVTDGIENLPPSLYKQFDLVFSVATFQHIIRFGPALFSMYHALRPSGQLIAKVGPIWTAPNGHLLTSVVDEIGREISSTTELIPPWSHLVWSRPEFYVEMCKRIDQRSAGEIVFRAFDSKRINRLWFDDYISYLRSSPFEGNGKIVKHITQSMPDGLQKHLARQFPRYSHFDVYGFTLFLQRA